MPPAGSGDGEKNADAWRKAAVACIISFLTERALVVCLPKLRLNEGDPGDLDVETDSELMAALMGAVNAVRREQGKGDAGASKIWSKVLDPLKRESGTGDPAAFRAAAERYGLGGFPAVRPTRANSAHVTASAAENAAPQPPPPPALPPSDSPPRKPLWPSRVLATQSSAPSCSTALVTPPRDTRRGVTRMEQIEAVKVSGCPPRSTQPPP